MRQIDLGRGLIVEYIDDYHPYHQGNNPAYNQFSQRVLIGVKRREYVGRERFNALQHFCQLLVAEIHATSVLCCVPSSSIDSPESGILAIARELAKRCIDGTGCLVRHTNIEPAHRGGRRDYQQHLNTIRVDHPEILQGRNIVLFDDIVTSGKSMRACRDLLIRSGAASVRCVAIGRTV